MYVEWTKHLQDNSEAKNIFTRKILSSREVLDRIKDIIEEKEKAIDRSETSIEAYNTPNWDVRQAHKNGNRESLNWLKKLVDLDQQKGTEFDR